MLLSNHFKQYILLIFSISIIELVKFSLPAESPTFSRNNRRNSGSRDRHSPSRYSTAKTRLYKKKEQTYRANERRQQILRRQNINRNFIYQRQNLLESRVRQGFRRRWAK